MSSGSTKRTSIIAEGEFLIHGNCFKPLYIHSLLVIAEPRIEGALFETLLFPFLHIHTHTRVDSCHVHFLGQYLF
jgi:hypothetical protein